LYKRLKPYILTEEQLKQNNFPRSDPVNGGCAVFFGENFNKNKGKTKGMLQILLEDISIIVQIENMYNAKFLISQPIPLV